MKMLVLVLGLAVAAWAAYIALKGTAHSSLENVGGSPVRSLENVREAARRIEVDSFRRAGESSEPAQNAPHEQDP